MDNSLNSIASKIRAMLKYKEMKQSDLCRNIDIERGNLSRSLNGNTYKTEVLKKYAEGMDCDIEIYFLDRETGKKI